MEKEKDKATQLSSVRNDVFHVLVKNTFIDVNLEDDLQESSWTRRFTEPAGSTHANEQERMECPCPERSTPTELFVEYFDSFERPQDVPSSSGSTSAHARKERDTVDSPPPQISPSSLVAPAAFAPSDFGAPEADGQSDHPEISPSYMSMYPKASEPWPTPADVPQPFMPRGSEKARGERTGYETTKRRRQRNGRYSAIDAARNLQQSAAQAQSASLQHSGAPGASGSHPMARARPAALSQVSSEAPSTPQAAQFCITCGMRMGLNICPAKPGQFTCEQGHGSHGSGQRRHCHFCGTKVGPNFRFCHTCGKFIATSITPT